MNVAGVGPIQSIEISVDDMIRQAVQGAQATAATFEVGGSHIGRIFADDSHECRFELSHLTRDVCCGEGAQRWMRPPNCALAKLLLLGANISQAKHTCVSQLDGHLKSFAE